MTDGLEDAHRAAIVDVLAANERVERAVLFGSRATETFTDGSDVDIALFGEELTIADRARLAEAMEELTVPHRVDVLLYDGIDNETLRKHIRRDGIEWYERREDAPGVRLHLKPEHRRVLEALLRERLPGVEVWAYGSRVSGRSHNGSDLDLVLRGPGLEEIPAGRLADFEEAARESALPFLVEARDWARLPERFHREIERDHVVLVERTDKDCSSCGWIIQKLGDLVYLHKEQMTPALHPRVKFSHFSIPAFDSAKEPKTELGSEIGSNKFIVPNDSILVSRLNPRIARVWEPRVGMIPAVASTEFLVFQPKNVFRRFLKYLLLSPRVRSELMVRVTGTSGSHQRVLPSDALNIDVLVPPLPEQRAIAHVLGTLDDRIELNRRMNETLEAMTRALFKSWFVDFDPVRAKMAGRDPQFDFEIWNLFPDALDDEDKPVGWNSRSLDEIAEFLNGLALQKFPALNSQDSLPVIKISELRRGITTSSDRASLEIPEKYIVKDKDFLFSWSGSLLARFWTGGEGALNQHLFKVSSDRYPRWFFSQWIYHHLERFQAIAASKATTMGHIQRVHLKEAMTLCPPDDALNVFGGVMGPLVERSIENELEARTLTRTRDVLLSKLISGDIRVPEAGKMLEAVA